jgi:hypothetical protein
MELLHVSIVTDHAHVHVIMNSLLRIRESLNFPFLRLTVIGQERTGERS